MQDEISHLRQLSANQRDELVKLKEVNEECINRLKAAREYLELHQSDPTLKPSERILIGACLNYVVD